MQIQFNSIGYKVHKVVGVKKGENWKTKKEYLPTYFLLIQIQFPHMHSHVYLISIQIFFLIEKMYVLLMFHFMQDCENSKTILPDGWHHVEYPPHSQPTFIFTGFFFYDNQCSLSFLRSFLFISTFIHTRLHIVLKLSQMSHFCLTSATIHYGKLASYFMISSPSHSPIMWFSSWG